MKLSFVADLKDARRGHDEGRQTITRNRKWRGKGVYPELPKGAQP